MPQVLRLEMDLEVERAAAEAAAAGRAVGQAGEAARLTTLRRELASKEARGAEVERPRCRNKGRDKCMR